MYRLILILKQMFALLILSFFFSACWNSPNELVSFQDRNFDRNDVLRISSTIPSDVVEGTQICDWVVGRVVLETLTDREALDPEVEAMTIHTARRIALRNCIAKELAARFAGAAFEAEARQLYDADPAHFDAPERVELQMIFIPEERIDSAEVAQELLDATTERVADFGRIAWNYSASESANRGGHTGSIEVEQLAPEIQTAIRDHRDDQTPFLLSGPRGHYIILVLNYYPALRSTFDTSRTQVIQELTKVLESRLLDELGTEFDTIMAGSIEEVFRRPLLESHDVVYQDAEGESEILLKEVTGGLSPGDAVAGPFAFEMTQSYLRDRRLAEALGCQVSPSEVGTTLLRQARREQALGKAVYEVTPEAVHEFIELHRHVLLHEADYVLDLAVFPWGNETPAATLDRSRMVMDALAGGEASPEDLRAAGAELFLGVTMSETQAMHYDPDLAAALRSMPLGVYSLPASSNRAGGFLMVKLTERDSDRPLDPEEEADRKMIARIYLQSQGDQAVERVLEKLKLQTSARCEEIEKLIGTTEEAMP